MKIKKYGLTINPRNFIFVFKCEKCYIHTEINTDFYKEEEVRKYFKEELCCEKAVFIDCKQLTKQEKNKILFEQYKDKYGDEIAKKLIKK